MKDSATWILLANEQAAQICVSHKGVTHKIGSLDGRAPYSFGWLPASSQRGTVVPFNPQLVSSMSRDQARRYLFACEIVLDLLQQVKPQHCDGLMMVCTSSMASALRLAAPPCLSQLLISQVEMPEGWQMEGDAEPEWAIAS